MQSLTSLFEGASWRKRTPFLFALPFLVLAIGLLLTYVVWDKTHQSSQLRLKGIFEYRVEQARLRLDNRLHSYQQILEDAAGLLLLSPALDQRGFHEYVSRLDLDRQFPGTQAIGYLPYVPAEAMGAFLQQQKRLQPDFALKTPGVRDAYGPVIFIEPMSEANQKVIGVDLFAEPVRHASLSRARDEARTIISGRLVLVQDWNKERVPGVLISSPIFRRGSPTDTLEARRRNLQGWVAAPLRISDLLAGVLGQDLASMSSLLRLRIFDVGDDGKTELLYQSQGTEETADQGSRWLVIRDIPVGGRIWRTEYSALPGFESSLGEGSATSLALLGGFGSVSMALVLWLLINGRYNALRLAGQMTRELRTSKKLLQSVIEGTTDAIFVKDTKGRYQLANAETARWLGASIGDILGRSDADFLAPALAESLRLEDAGVMQQSGVYTIEKQIVTHGDVQRTILVTKGALRTADGKLTGMFGIARDITERKRMEQQIAVFQSLAESIGDPVYIISPALGFKNVYVNAAACRHFGKSREELLSMCIPDWDPSFPDAEALNGLWQRVKAQRVLLFESVQRTMAGQMSPVEVLANYLIHDGEEYIAGTFRDISLRKETEEQLKLAASVFRAANEGVVICDPENRILAINPAFTLLTGYVFEEVEGRHVSLLKSGQHDEKFYQAMWEAILLTGKWQGEIWNRKKNGDLYPEYLRIATIYDDAGAVFRRFAIFADITQQKADQELIWHQANYDALTELPNRRLFRDRLQQEIKRAHRSQLHLAVLFIDLDRFKEVNDTLGHDFGDQLLIEAGRRIRECVRESDTVARLGGDEFILILPELNDIERPGQVAQALLNKLSDPYRFAGGVAYVSASIGITIYPEDGQDDASLIQNADQAMYATKENGRRGFSFFTPSMQSSVQESMRLANDLRHALAKNELEVHFQPIVSLAQGRVCKAEALLRWRHPERGMIAPADFIPIAEETGLIVEIGDWVFKQAALFARDWYQCLSSEAERDVWGDASPRIQVSVNMSPRQFLGASDISAWVDFLGELDIPPHSMVVEITEGLLLDDRPSVFDKLAKLRAGGIGLALDDFGTGYSAMSYLKQFAVDYLKIDQSFIRDMVTDANDQAIVEAIILMAHKLGIKVIAEGVETKDQMMMLSLAECDLAQGYLFGRPVAQACFMAELSDPPVSLLPF